MKKIIAALTAGFIAGWMINHWRYQSNELGDIKSMIAIQQKNNDITQKHGKILEELLTQKRVNDEEFDVLLSKMVNKNSDNLCFDADFIRLFNEKIHRDQKILSREPADKMPDSFTRN